MNTLESIAQKLDACAPGILYRQQLAEILRAVAHTGADAILAEPAQAGEAVELTVCCGREECGGECGNEWRGTEWVRKATPPAATADKAWPDDAAVRFREAFGRGVMHGDGRFYFDASDAERVRAAAAALAAAAPQAPVGGVDEALVQRALRKAFSLGERHWQQADSEYTSQHRKADETMAKFRAHIDETLAALQQPARESDKSDGGEK